MPINVDHTGSVLSDPSSQAVSPPGQVTSLVSNDKGIIQDGSSAEMGDSLGAKPTYYRLLVVTTAVLWAVPKAVLSYKHRSIEATTIDMFAALFGVVLYWVGLHEARRREDWDWFFKDELAPTFGIYLFSRAEWALSFLCDMLVHHPFISLFLIGAGLLLARYLPNWGTAIVSIGLTVPIVIIFMSLLVRDTSRRTQLHTQ
jgi:hypothetical protein